MSPVNGQDHSAPATSGAAIHPDETREPASSQFASAEVRELVTRLEVPFDPCYIYWRVMNVSRNDKLRGQVIPYADQRAYTDRLNYVFTPAGWSRKYTVHTSANFQRSKDDKIVAKVFVTCELIIFGLGAHSATGEEWADDENAGTSAEAQAFKRSCSCFGLGRYLYYFEGIWVDLDERKRPKSVPQLPAWATPQGWMRGLRPPNASLQDHFVDGEQSSNATPKDSRTLIAEIEGMAEVIGKSLYRGILRDVARTWNPRHIKQTEVLQKVHKHMCGAQRGVRRLEKALDGTGAEVLTGILKGLGIDSLKHVTDLEMLKRVVVAAESVVPTHKT
ncbi:MAG TPA: Rad52/Rad22 family DNA repair protein [Candidatus Angelobacter sp.]|nr:Rad52/Rad22 family DNA repair protein [Candidatus Angelobacter sp.]